MTSGQLVPICSVLPVTRAGALFCSEESHQVVGTFGGFMTNNGTVDISQTQLSLSSSGGVLAITRLAESKASDSDNHVYCRTS